MSNNIYAVVRRFKTEQTGFADWEYKPDDLRGICGRVYSLTDDFIKAKAAADWANSAAVGKIYPFEGGEIEIKEID